MKFGVVTFPGSNCDDDMRYALQDILGQEVIKLWHKDSDLQGCDVIALPGGFSYGDALRSGSIARFSPIMTEVIKHANNGGTVFGVCNGFQILCEAGLLPGALLHNDSQKFICKNVHLKPVSKTAAFTVGLDSTRSYKIPIAHGEGRYYAKEDDIKALWDNDQVLFQYCDALGNVSDESNPNGAVDGIAGVCNKEKNIFGMMPHPERAVDKYLGNKDGKFLLESLINNVLINA